MTSFLPLRFTLPAQISAGLPDGEEVFAIGDVHGCADLLRAALDAIAVEPRQAPVRRLVLLGDLIDRSPDFLGALDLACDAAALAKADEAIALMGNHEIMLKQILAMWLPQDVRDVASLVWARMAGCVFLTRWVCSNATSFWEKRWSTRLRSALERVRPVFLNSAAC